MLDGLKTFLDEVKHLRANVKAIPTNTVGSKELRGRAETIGSRWCNNLAQELYGPSDFRVGKS